MEFARLQKNWTNLGRRDPLWAILSDPHARGGNWDLDAFLRTGVDFGQYLVRHCRGLELPVARARALDFGCGYGRLTQALAGWFDEAIGVDIAETMIAGAREIDRSGGRCKFLLNQSTNLRQFSDATFDFVLTVLVLQHMRPEYSLGYVREFLRVLRPGGVAFFQVPSEPLWVPPQAGARRRSPAPEPLPLDQLRANVAVHPGMLALHCADWHWVRVHLHNQGTEVLRAGTGPGQVHLATRWHSFDGTPGEPTQLSELPHDVLPGDVARVLVPLRAPADPGPRLLQFLAVQGGLWVESPTCAAARIVVQVAPRDAELVKKALLQPMPSPPQPPRGASDSDQADEAEIEVHGVPVADIARVVRAAGGELVDVAEDVWAGPDWLSAHYTVRKR